MDTITLDDLMVAPVQTPLPAARKPKVDFTPNPEKKRGRGRRGRGVAVFESAVAPRAADRWHEADRAKARRSKNRRAVTLRERHTGATRLDPRRHETEDRALERQAHNARVAAQAARRYQGRAANRLDDEGRQRPSRAPRTKPKAQDAPSRLERAFAKYRRTGDLPPIVTAPPESGGLYVLRSELAELKTLRPASVNQAQYGRFLRALLVRAGVEMNPGPPTCTRGSLVLGLAALNAYAIALYISLLPDLAWEGRAAIIQLTAACLVLSYFVGRHALFLSGAAVAVRFTWFYLRFLMAATHVLAQEATRLIHPVASAAVVAMSDAAHPDGYTELRSYDSVLATLVFYSIIGCSALACCGLRTRGPLRWLILAAAMGAVGYYTYIHGLVASHLNLAITCSLSRALGHITSVDLLFNLAMVTAVFIAYIRRAWITLACCLFLLCAYHLSYRWLLLLAGIEPNPGPQKKKAAHRRKLNLKPEPPVVPIPGCTQRAAEELAAMGLSPESTCICCNTLVGCRRGSSEFCFECGHGLRYHSRSGGDMPGTAGAEAPPPPDAPAPSAPPPPLPGPVPAVDAPQVPADRPLPPPAQPAPVPSAPPLPDDADEMEDYFAPPAPVVARALNILRPVRAAPVPPPAAPAAPPLPQPPAGPEAANALARQACRGEHIDPREFAHPDRDQNGLPSVAIKLPTTGLTVIEPPGPVLDGIRLTDRQLRPAFFALGGTDWLMLPRLLGLVEPPSQIERRVAADAAFGRERRLVVDRGVKYTHADVYVVDCSIRVPSQTGMGLLYVAMFGLACFLANVALATIRAAVPVPVPRGVVHLQRLLVMGFPMAVIATTMVCRLPSCMQTARMSYCPHMLSCCVREFGHSSTSEAVRANVTTKLLRLATVQLPDVEAAQCTRGTEAAAVHLLEERDFFGLSAA